MSIGLLISISDKQDNWNFLRVALNFFIKAFFCEETQEQMLWHITTLEALLGEKGKGVTKRLARRIATILGETEAEREIIRKQFEELYDFRCDLVHGGIPQKQPYVGHLRQARKLARDTLCWFLRFLGHIQTQLGATVPTRKDILACLEHEHTSRLRVSVPDGFPHVREWME